MEQEHEPVASRQLRLQQGVWARARFSCPGACPRVCAEARGQAGLGDRLPTGGVCAGPGELVRLGQDVAGGGEERALLALPQGEAPGVQIWKDPSLCVVPGHCPQRHAGLAASLPVEPGGQLGSGSWLEVLGPCCNSWPLAQREGHGRCRLEQEMGSDGGRHGCWGRWGEPAPFPMGSAPPPSSWASRGRTGLGAALPLLRTGTAGD